MNYINRATGWAWLLLLASLHGPSICSQDFSSFLTSVRVNDKHVCAGALLNSQWSITVAHCVEGQLTEWVTVEARDKVHTVLKIVKHPRYSPINMDYNVALIMVDAADDMTSTPRLVKSVPSLDAQLSVLGCTKEPAVKEVRLVRLEECNAKYRNFGGVSPRMLCVETLDPNLSLCHSDGGSAVVLDGALLGLVSHGLGCDGVPTVILRVSAFLTWINQVTASNR